MFSNKNFLANDPILLYPNFTEAWNFAIEAILSQGTIPNYLPILYNNDNQMEVSIRWIQLWYIKEKKQHQFKRLIQDRNTFHRNKTKTRNEYPSARSFEIPENVELPILHGVEDEFEN